MRYAASLFAEGYGQWILTTNPPSDTPGIRMGYGQLMRQEAELNGVPAEQIVDIEQRVYSTLEEAQAVRLTAEAQGWQSLLVVTSPYHTRRSRLIYRDVFRDSAIEIRVVPVINHWYEGATWWQDNYSVQATFLEYLKFLAHWGGYH